MTTALSGMVLTEVGWCRGEVTFDQTIQSIRRDDAAPADRLLLPGFVDLHVHGGDGADCMDGEEAVRHLAAFHARHGTTSLLATTVTAPATDLERAFSGIGRASRGRPGSGARVLGAHLEGPFINPARLGAQPPFTIAPDPELVDRLHALAPIRVATIAPELDPGHGLVAQLAALGCRVQIGHSDADAEQARAALAAGCSGVTHLFNAMSPFSHRAPGVAGAALAWARHAEIIADLVHVDPIGIRLALRAIPGLYVVTDAVAAAGRPPGRYRLGRHEIHMDGHAARLADGTLAGSVLTMHQALLNLTGPLGLEIAEASRRLSSIAAAYLSEDRLGRLAPGAHADLVALDPGGRLLGVWVDGEEIDLGV